ncbi:MAG: flagellar hook-associated protein 3 [Halobacteriovoraceae bacterium]|nr:flagellar hook-associated protein 3 [Halobacteriovoraceae bacterium]|tara:strand:+ start:12643 stop:13728 length:1086 start_codon:yes stop_codon:yes gene_type:complete
MARVSEASSFHAIQHAVNKTKSRLEDLQIKGSTLKRVQKPSDDPVGNIDILSIRSKNIDGKQYERNASVAKAQLTFTENAISELTDVLNKAKEIAVAQASNLFDVNIRRGVAKEVEQLKNQAVSIANRRMGNKYIFAGHKSLTKPFNEAGEYLGDSNQTKIEVQKDYFVPISFNGKDIFYEKEGLPLPDGDPLAGSPLADFNKKVKIDGDQVEIDESLNTPVNESENSNQENFNRTPATEAERAPELGPARTSVFSDLQKLHDALITDNHEIIQDLLPKLDKAVDRLIESRAKIGSILNTVDSAVESVQKQHLLNEEYRTQIEDADLAELFTDLTRQKNVLDATYKASAQLMNKNLMDYIN